MQCQSSLQESGRNKNLLYGGWEGVEMDYVAIKSINYWEDFRLVLEEGQFEWE